MAESLSRAGLGLFLLLAFFAAFSYTRAGGGMRAHAAASDDLNFQARLLSASGSIVADGTYSIQFNLYNVASGGSTQWTETQGSVTVKSGYLSAHLGSVTPFPGTIDWSQEQWLTMNVNGDGEMNPRLKLTSVPLAFRANQADRLTNGASSLTANDIAQLAPGTPQVISSALAALRINQSGAGGLIQFQNTGVDMFTVANNGNLVSSGSGTFSGGTLNLGTVSQSGGLVLYDGSSNTGLLQVSALSSNRTYTLPDVDGTICLTTTCVGGGGSSFVQDGNSFASTATLGTNDNFDLNFETAGTTKLKILTNGNVGVGTSGTPSALLSVGGTTGNLTVDSSGNLATTGNVQSTAQFLAASGTAAAPTYSFTADPNSGLYSGGADNLRVVTGGADRLTVTSAGRVGIGTTDPSGLLSLTTGSTAMFGNIDSPFVSFGSYQNFLLQTEAFNTANWVKTGIGAVTANSATDPRFVATAENIPAGGSGTSNQSQVITNATTGDWTFSVYLRSQAGTVTTDLRIDSNAPLTGTSKTVTLTTEWQRFAITQNISAAHTTKTVFIVSGTNAISAWGAQFEPNSYARPYSGARTTVALPALTTTGQIGTALNVNGALSIVGALSGATTGAFSNVVTISGTGIAAASTDRLAISNATAATVGIPVQMSPRLRFSGTVWNTTSSASNTTNWKIENLPLSGATPSGQLVFGHDLNAGGYTNALVLNSNGNAAFAGSISTGGTTRLTSTGVLQNITGLTVISGGASITGNVTLGGSSADRLTVNGQILGGSPLVFQGATDNGFATTLAVTNPTANNTITLPDASGTVVLDSRSILTAAGSGLTGGGNLSVDRSLSLDINGLTTKTVVNNNDYLAVHDSTTSSVRKISRSDFLQGVIGAMQYQGTWNASTNTPTLADNTGTNGHVYAVSVGGTQNLGSGNITFGTGDFAIHNGTKWEVAPSASPVVSIFGRGGTVTAQNGDYTATQITNTAAGNIAAITVQAAINELDNEKLGSLNGLSINSQTFANDTNVTITSAGSTHSLGWSGQLSVGRGGTGAGSFTTNGVIYGNNTGALQVTAAGTSGQVLIADSGGVPTFRTISGDITIDDLGVATVSGAAPDSVALGTDTTGDYIMNLGTLIGLSTTGNSGESSTPGLSVLYGSAANTAVQGNTTLVCTSGTGNLSGTGNTITLGTGGTCNALDTNAAVTFATSVTTPILTSAGGLAISSGGSGGISLDSASNIVTIAANDTTLQRTASGVYSIDLNDTAATTLRLINSDGTGVANLNLADGGLQIGGTGVLSSGRALSNLTGISTTGALVFNSFSGAAGLLSVDTSGNVSVTAASGFEVPLTFDNGLTRSGNNVKLGGALTGLTDIATGSNNLTLSGNGFIGIGSTSAQYKLDVRTPGVLAAQLHISSSNTDAGGYLLSVNDFQLLASGGAAFNGTNTIAKATAATIFGSNVSGSFIVQSNSGLTVGASYTPTNRLVIDASTGLATFTNNMTINGGTLGSTSSGFTLLATPTNVAAFGAATTLSLGVSTGTTTINGNTLTSTGLTFVGAGATAIQAANNQNLTVNTQGTGVLALNTGSTGVLTTNATTIQRSGSSLTLDVANAGLSTLNVSNSNGSNLTNLDVSGGIFAGNGNAFSVNSDGDLTSVFTALNGTSTANGGSGLGTSTSLTLTSAANFDIGNYVQMNSANCGGTGINPCYAKITNKAGNVLTITPALRWTTGATVNEYHIPEIGGTNALDTLTNRYGRGYFISGVATGNGTTFYNEDSIATTLTTFDLLNSGVTTLNIGGAATTLNIGNASGTTTIAGTVAFSGNTTAPSSGTSGYLTRAGTTLSPANSGDNFSTSGNLVTTGSGTITSAGLLTVQAGGASISGGLSLLTGALNLTSGGITNAGSIGGVAGLTFTSGALNLASGGITNAGSVAGVTTLGLSGAITGATATNTINGLIINSGNLTGITGATFTSGNLALGGGNISGVGTLNISGLATLGAAASVTGDVTVTNGKVLIQHSSAGASVIVDKTSVGAKIGSLKAGDAKVAFFFDDTGSFSISKDTRANISAGTGAGTDLLSIASTGAITVAGSITGVSNLSLTGSVAGLTYMDFSTSASNPAHQEGRLFYDNTQKALSYYNIEAQTTLNIGQENYIYVYNNTGSTINDGQAVYINGVNAGAPTVALARADNLTTSRVVGVATHSIENATFGFITNFGEINGLNTSGYTAGDTLYLSAATAGLLTSTRPTIPNITSVVARVTEVNASTGKIVIMVGDATEGAFTTGRIGFGSSNGMLIEDSNFFWDNTAKRLALGGDATPDALLSVGSTSQFQVSTTGALTTAGLTTLNGGLTVETGDTFTFNGDAFTDLTSNGLIISSGVLTLDVTTAGTVAGTGSNSGLVTAADGLSLLRGCSNNQILKWSTTGPQWNCAADATGISDARLKKNVVAINDDLLDRVASVQLYKFDYDCAHSAFQYMHCDTDHQEAGVIAQELAQVFPELVMEVNGYYQVRYNALSLYNLKAVGELARKVEAIDTSSGDTTNGVQTGGTIRVDENGALQNITGLNMLSGGASLSGGIDNNSGGITEAGAISGATSIEAQTIRLSANAADDLLKLTKDNKGVFTIFNDGSLEMRLDSANVFSIKDASGIKIFNIDSLSGRVSIGSGDTSKTVLFTLDNRALPDDPPGTNGSSYYNTALQRFRCYQADKWTDCLPAGDLTDPIALDKTTWLQPSADQEFPGTPRIVPNLERAHEFRLRIRITSPGAAGATCRLQYAAVDAGPWNDLPASGSGELSISQNGTLKTDWLKLADGARKQDIIVRTMCKGGDGAHSVVFYGLSMQLR